MTLTKSECRTAESVLNWFLEEAVFTPDQELTEGREQAIERLLQKLRKSLRKEPKCS